MNFVLRDIGSTLLTLESDAVFKTNTVPPTNCFIKEVSDTLMQIGTFHDTLSNYFIIVNRHCLAGVYNVAVSVTSPAPLYLWDCLSEEVISCTHKPDPGDLWEFVITLFSGEGRLIQLVVDETPPASPYVFSKKSGDDLELTWNKVTTDTLGNQETMDYYVVYRDTAPSFIPDSLDSIGSVVHPETTYIDSNALNASGSYYYLVKAVDAAQNASRKSNMAFKFSKFFNENPLTTDRNWVSLPWHCNYDSVNNVANDLSATGDPLTKITNLRDDQYYESWLWDPDLEFWYGTDFDILSGRGYEMITTMDTSLFLVGSNNPNGLVTLNENPSTTDRNWVSIPYNAIYSTVQDITEEHSPSGYPLVKITNLRNDQLYESWLWDDSFPNEAWYGTNFTIERGRGYEFVTTVDTTWNPTEYSNESGGSCMAKPKGQQSYSTTSVGSSCVPDRIPVWVIDTVDENHVDDRVIKGNAYGCADLYKPLHVIVANVERTYRGTSYLSASEISGAAPKGSLQFDEREKISHIVRAHILDASVYEAIVFTAYCLDRPKDVLTEQMVGSAVVQNSDVTAVWFDAGNFQVPWQEGEEAVFIVEAIREGKPYIDIEHFKLDETVDIQELGTIKLEPSFTSGSQRHAQSLFMCKPADDNIIGYSLYQNGKRLNERVLQGKRSIPPDVSVKLVIIGGYETIYSSDGIEKEPDKALPLSFAFAVTPNPFVKQTRIDYALPKQASIEIVIYDVSGRKVKTLASERQNAGYYSTIWNGLDDQGRQVASDVYFVRFEASEFVAQDKILLVK